MRPIDSKHFVLAFFSLACIELLLYLASKGLHHKLHLSWIYFTILSTDAAFHNTSTPNASQPLDVSLFVSYHKECLGAGRLGNQISNFAAVLFVSELSGRKPAFWKSSRLLLDPVFRLNVDYIEDLCPCQIIEEKRKLSYDPELEKIDFVTHPNFTNSSIIIRGNRQSWNYTVGIEKQLRRQLIFRNEIQRLAEQFLEDTRPQHWKRIGFIRVGIHIRRGDFLAPIVLLHGLTVAPEKYFYKAMKYFTDRYNRVQFIVASNDMKWAFQYITIGNSSTQSVNIAFSVNHNPGEDLAILSMCNHMIMSTGTYGWWSGWLAGGTTIYYSNYPRKGSMIERDHSRKEDLFPPSWIPMDDS